MSESIKRSHDAVLFYMSEFSSRVVAESGFPGDRFHIGKLIFQGLKDDPDFISQINGANNESETNESVLLRSIKCAITFKKLGLKKGDVIVLMAFNHLDLVIPFYAALYLGIIVAALDDSLGANELKGYFSVDEPKIVFCEAEKFSTVQTALTNAGVDSRIVAFGDGNGSHNFKNFMKLYEDDIAMCETAIKEFKPADFDPEETLAMLAATSGSTGSSKAVACTHKNFAIAFPYTWLSHSNYPTPTKLLIVVAPLQWLSAVFHYVLSPILKFTRLQTSDRMSPEVFRTLVNKYKPTYIGVSPTLLKSLWKIGDTNCDMTCFETIFVGGSAVPQDLLDDIRKIKPDIQTGVCYGLSEVGGLAMYEQFQKRGSIGKPMGCFDSKLVNPETLEVITEPYVNGELWLRGPSVCKGYYKCPEATSETFLKDGWVRSGDILYRDEDWNFYFVERLKLLMKYKNHQISPLELEAVIRQHPAVYDVAVVGLPDPDCGDLPVAFVVPKQNTVVTAQEIKDIVKDSLTDSKHLRGGVVFINELPLTVNTKVNRPKLKEMVKVVNRE